MKGGDQPRLTNSQLTSLRVVPTMLNRSRMSRTTINVAGMSSKHSSHGNL